MAKQVAIVREGKRVAISCGREQECNGVGQTSLIHIQSGLKEASYRHGRDI